MPPKRNAYTFFVRERSRAGGPLNPALFARYDQEWKVLQFLYELHQVKDYLVAYLGS